MYLPVLLLICLSVIQLSMGDQPVEEVIVPKRINLLGGWSSISPDSQDAQRAAKHAVEMFNTKSKSKKMFKLVSITAAQHQVTNVINYRIDAILGKTKCLKSENHALNSCNPDKKQLKCQFTVILDRRDNHRVLSQKCKKLTEKI